MVITNLAQSRLWISAGKWRRIIVEMVYDAKDFAPAFLIFLCRLDFPQLLWKNALFPQ